MKPVRVLLVVVVVVVVAVRCSVGAGGR